MSRLPRAVVAAAALVVVAGTFAAAAIATHSQASGYTVVGPFINQDARDVTTCGTGTVWASGKTTNAYKVLPRRPDGSYVVLEAGTGRLVTAAGQSVGACNNRQADNGGTVSGGVKVQVSFQALWVIRNGVFDPDATCETVNPSCFVFAFARSFFGASATVEAGPRIAFYETRCNGSWVGDPFTPTTIEAGDITGENVDCEG